MKHPGWEYPEIYSAVTVHYDQLQVAVNRALGQVRLQIKTLRGDHYESIIRNGIVLREKDLRSGALVDLADIFAGYSKDFSSLPDTPILSLIGGNYGILTEFIGTAERFRIEQKNLWQRLADVAKNLVFWLKKRWLALRDSFGYYRQAARAADLFDCLFIGGCGYAMFSYNFDFLVAGFTLWLSAMLTGICDWLLRKREPWLLKIYAALGGGAFAIYLGYAFQ